MDVEQEPAASTIAKPVAPAAAGSIPSTRNANGLRTSAGMLGSVKRVRRASQCFLAGSFPHGVAADNALTADGGLNFFFVDIEVGVDVLHVVLLFDAFQ